MRFVLPPLCVLLVALLSNVPAVAQLMHLSVDAPLMNLKLRGDKDHLNEPWDTFGHVGYESPFKLDIYFERDLPNLGTPGEGGHYLPTDPTKNFWRMRFSDPTNQFHFDISRPLESILVGESVMIFAYANDDAPFEEMETWLEFTAPLPNFPDLPDGSPLPALDTEDSRLFAQGSGFFDFEGLGEALVGASFTTVTATPVPDFTPVPEPSTYGALAGAAGCALVIWRVRRQRRPRLPAA